MAKPPRRNIFLLLSKSENRQEINEIIDDPALSEKEKEVALRPLMSDIAFYEYKQWRSNASALKEKLPFLRDVESDSAESIILELVHERTLPEERKDQILRNILSPASFQEYLKWKPTNIVITPDSFLRLLEDGTRHIAQRRLNAKDFEALDIFMTAIGGESLAVYDKWKGQLKKQGKALASPALGGPPMSVKIEAADPSLLAITQGETVQSYEEMLGRLAQKSDQLKETVHWKKEQMALIQTSGGGQLCQTGPTTAQISLLTHMQGAHMAAASLAQLAEAVWSKKPGENFEFEVEHTTVRSLKEEIAETTAEELRKQFQMDAVNNFMANERLLEADGDENNKD